MNRKDFSFQSFSRMKNISLLFAPLISVKEGNFSFFFVFDLSSVNKMIKSPFSTNFFSLFTRLSLFRRWKFFSFVSVLSTFCLGRDHHDAMINSSCFSTSSRWKEEIQRRRNRSARQKCFIRIGHSSEQCSTNSFVQQWSIYSLFFNSLIHRLIIVQHCTLRSFHFSQFVQHFLEQMVSTLRYCEESK